MQNLKFLAWPAIAGLLTTRSASSRSALSASIDTDVSDG